MTGAGAGSEPADLRLLPSAVAVWLVSALLPLLGVAASAAVTVSAAVAALVLRSRPALVVVMLVTAAVGAGVGIRLEARDRGPLDELAEAGRTAVVVATVAEEPRRSLRRTWGAVPVAQVVVRVRVTQTLADQVTTSTRQPLLVVGQGEGWGEVEFGDRVELSVALHPADPGDQVAAVGWVRGPPRVLSGPSPLLAGAESMRSGPRSAAAGLAPDPRGLLPSLVVGDTAGLGDDLVADLRVSGLAHLTAVSRGAVLTCARYPALCAA